MPPCVNGNILRIIYCMYAEHKGYVFRTRTAASVGWTDRENRNQTQQRTNEWHKCYLPDIAERGTVERNARDYTQHNKKNENKASKTRCAYVHKRVRDTCMRRETHERQARRSANSIRDATPSSLKIIDLYSRISCCAAVALVWPLCSCVLWALSGRQGQTTRHVNCNKILSMIYPS